ncbi:hypothetical protein JW707_03685 [Candidatus Woesearchaeota archaeon]|nr:hypothetical protein [Candidatus Woesearchaeota archaeon]
MNKKAQYITFMLLIIWAVFLVYEILVVVTFSSGYVNREIDVRDAEARIFANRILYSFDGIAYVDGDLGKVFPGTVDLKKLDSDYLDSVFWMEDNQVMAAKITVTNLGTNTNHSAIYNDRWYYRMLPLAGKSGSGASTEILEKRYVAIYDGDEYKGQGMLEIQLLVPNA